MTSEQLAAMLSTHQVVVRRMLAGLRERGYVQSDKGHGGGWTLARKLDDITLLEVHRALGDPSLFAVELLVDHPECLVEQAVHSVLSEALGQAERALLARLGQVTLGDLARDLERRKRRTHAAGPSRR
jgi:DNA-binding IscR family transcriptional regulator